MVNNIKLNRRDIAKRIRKHVPELTIKEIDKVLSVYVDIIGEELEKSNIVNVSGLGKFEVKTITKKVHYNPLDGNYIESPVTYERVTFKSSKVLRDRLNKKDKE